MTVTPAVALPREELLDTHAAHLGECQPTTFEPPAEPRHLPKLIDRRQRRIARSSSSARYASANGATGPVINTLLTLVIHSSFSRYRSGKDDHNRSRYADIAPANIPTCADFLTKLGITTGSA